MPKRGRKGQKGAKVIYVILEMINFGFFSDSRKKREPITGSRGRPLNSHVLIARRTE